MIDHINPVKGNYFLPHKQKSKISGIIKGRFSNAKCTTIC